MENLKNNNNFEIFNAFFIEKIIIKMSRFLLLNEKITQDFRAKQNVLTTNHSIVV